MKATLVSTTPLFPRPFFSSSLARFLVIRNFCFHPLPRKEWEKVGIEARRTPRPKFPDSLPTLPQPDSLLNPSLYISSLFPTIFVWAFLFTTKAASTKDGIRKTYCQNDTLLFGKSYCLPLMQIYPGHIYSWNTATAGEMIFCLFLSQFSREYFI